MVKDYTRWGVNRPRGQMTPIDGGQKCQKGGVNRPHTKERTKEIKKLREKYKKTMEYIPINDEGQEVKKVKGLKHPVSDRGPFNYQAELEKLKASGKNHQIVAHYLTVKKYQFENFEQFYPVLARLMKSAKDLKGYNSKQIGATMKHCEKEWPGNWTLETVAKWAPEIASKIK